MKAPAATNVENPGYSPTTEHGFVYRIYKPIYIYIYIYIIVNVFHESRKASIRRHPDSQAQASRVRKKRVHGLIWDWEIAI
jgi:hypothetical protein